MAEAAWENFGSETSSTPAWENFGAEPAGTSAESNPDPSQDIIVTARPRGTRRTSRAGRPSQPEQMDRSTSLSDIGADAPGAPMMAATTAEWSEHPDLDTNNIISSYARAGKPLADLNAVLRSQGKVEISGDQAGRYRQWQTFYRQHPNSRASAADYTNRVHNSLIDRFAATSTGVGLEHAANMAGFGIPSLVGGEDQRQQLRVGGAAHPTAALVGDIGGSVVGALGTELAAVRGAGALLPKVFAPTIEGATTAGRALPYASDVAYGAVTGANNAEPGHRLEGATEGAFLGAIARPVLEPLFRAAPAAARYLAGKIRGPNDVKELLEQGIHISDLPEGVSPRDVNTALRQMQALSDDAANFRGTPEPRAEDVFPAQPDHAANAEAWGQRIQREAAPFNGRNAEPAAPPQEAPAVQEIAPPVRPDTSAEDERFLSQFGLTPNHFSSPEEMSSAVARMRGAEPVEPVSYDGPVQSDPAAPSGEPSITRRQADGLFTTATETPKPQTPKQWTDALQAEADRFTAGRQAEDAARAEPRTTQSPDGTPVSEPPARTAPHPEDPAAPEPAPRAETDAPPEEVVSRLTEALKAAGKASKEQKARYSQERSNRLRAMVAARNGTSGEAGYRAELAQLRGEMGRVEFEGVRDQFSQSDIDGLFNHLRNNRSLSTFDQLNARTGLGKLLDGKVPTTGEIDLLGRVFPPDFVKAALRHRSSSNKVLDFMGNLLNLPRSMMSTLDLSAPFRQGLFLVGRREFWGSFTSMFKQFGSQRAFNGVMADIESRATYPLMEESGLSLTRNGHNLSAREEAFASQWAERIPGYGRLVKASERAYSGFLNKVRADTFDTLVRKSYDAGISFSDNPKALADIARFVNSATGRGAGGRLMDQAGPLLNSVFFSPRLIASRVNLLNPAYYATLSPVVRREAIKSLLSFGAIASTATGLAAAGGANVELDPRSSDFLKIRTGNTRFDIGGGFYQYITLGARLATNQTKTIGGNIRNFGEGYKPQTRAGAVGQFFRNKEAPVPSFVHDWAEGTNVIGEPFNLTDEAKSRLIPMYVQSLGEVMPDSTTSDRAKAAAAILGLFGVGTQTFDPNAPRPKKPPKWEEFSN